LRRRSSTFATLHLDDAHAVAHETASADLIKSEVARVLEAARAEGVREVEARVDVAYPSIEAGLCAGGFSRAGTRIEVDMPIDTALRNARSTASVEMPMVLRAASREEAASMLPRVTEDVDIHADPGGWVDAFLAEPALVDEPVRMQIATMAQRDIALMLLAVSKTSRTGGLYYLGLVQPQRGRGLARGLLCHALRTLLALGAQRYRDGTEASNAAACALLRGVAGEGPFMKTLSVLRIELL
jgi:ribosomal protein S18 acetylase RimI-like enzyme